MPLWFEGRTTADIVVTLVTVTDTTGIMSPRATNEGCCGMTEVAIQRGRNVGGVGLGIHANRRTTIMTGHTIVHDAGMIEHRAGKAKREFSAMTDTAILVG
jgi:hypothetical protein